ncbi:MAG: DUF4212 domain-containing protein [Deltaproteobacteria bacterium]|nr:DUF4212 domain-containing protein [Deltaproteobacteria bacterium]
MAADEDNWLEKERPISNQCTKGILAFFRLSQVIIAGEGKQGNRKWHKALFGFPNIDRRRIPMSSNVQYWEKTKKLMWTVLAIWFFFSFVIHFFVKALNNIVILGFPMGFYFAAQGSLIVFVVLIFWYAKKQNAIDEEHGVSET